MKTLSISKILVLFLSVALLSCNSDDDKYKSFSGPQEALLFNNLTSVLEVTGSQSSFIEVLVSSTTISDVDRTIPIKVSPFSSATPNQYSINFASAVIPAGQNTAKIKITSGDFNSLPLSGGKDLVLVVGSGYVLPNRNNHVVSIERGCLNTKADLSIAFDSWASEITWSVRNSSNALVASSSGYADGLSSFKQRLCLTAGAYTFRMNDSYGDGLSDPTNGSFSIKLLNGTTLVSGGGNFGFSTGPLNFTIN